LRVGVVLPLVVVVVFHCSYLLSHLDGAERNVEV